MPATAVNRTAVGRAPPHSSWGGQPTATGHSSAAVCHLRMAPLTATLIFAAGTALVLLLVHYSGPQHAGHTVLAQAAQPAGFPACKAQVARILNDMIAEDAAGGWRQGGQAVLREQKRRRIAAASSAGNSTGSGAAGSRKHRALVAVPTANVWPKTQLLLHSLAAISDSFQLLVVDELSDDETPQRLHDMGIRMLQPPERLGVTHNWNMAYREWQRNSDADALFVINNDVLVPDGVIDALAAALTPEGGGCDMVGPLSTSLGLGTWRDVGLEPLFGLPPQTHAFVNNPLNYHRVQAALEVGGCSGRAAVHRVSDIQTRVPGVSGFFFGMRRSIRRFAFRGDEPLWDPANRIINQEGDLFRRAVAQPTAAGQPPAKFCLHTGAFVFHYKGGTIDPSLDRTKWQMPPAAGSRAAPLHSPSAQPQRLGS